MTVTRSLFAALVVAIACAPLQASTLVYYDLAGVPNAAVPSAEPTEVAAGILATDITRGPGINATGLTNGFSANGWNRDDPPPSRELALANGDYFQFGLSVDPLHVASLETLDLSLRRSAAAAPRNFELQASLDGFATPGIIISEFNYFGRTSGTAPDPDPLPTDPFFYMTNDLPGRPNTTTSIGDPIPTIDLTVFSELQNLPEGSEVTFRLYAWSHTTATTATNTLGLGRMVGPRIGGTVVFIPEPTSFLLLSCGLLVGLALRRGR